MHYEGEQACFFDQDTWSGKTSQEHSAATREKTLQPFSKKQSGLPAKNLPMCLCLKRDGAKPGASTMNWEDGALLGEFTTHSFGESPREENVSRLSQILEASPLPKYSLSAKACQGILNRAARRGKALPDALRIALENQCVSAKMQVENAE